MLKFIYRFNAAYDQIKEPHRLLTFLLIMIPLIGLASIPGLITQLLGWGAIALLIVMRLAYLNDWIK